MKGFVATPTEIAERMVTLLFEGNPPEAEDRILFPGVGEGPFIDAVQEYCEQTDHPYPDGYACDSHEERLETAAERHADLPVTFDVADFLDVSSDFGRFEYVIGNPPYVPITEIDDDKKSYYRREFSTGYKRFDLYLLFFERGLELLTDGGRLGFITPEKFEYTKTASPLRKLLSTYNLERLEHLDEEAFEGYLTYPTISVVSNTQGEQTQVVSQDGTVQTVELPGDGSRWTEFVRDIDTELESTGVSLGDVTVRISAGMATGADSVFVFDDDELPEQLKPWSFPTISGKQLEHQSIEGAVSPSSVFVCPYNPDGSVIPETELGSFGEWLEDVCRDTLKNRSCVEKGHRRWYAWHEKPPMEDMLQEKILFRDLTDSPRFWVDAGGSIVPRHTVYYMIPNEHTDLEALRSYLNSPEVGRWLQANCQKARTGYLRLQTRVLEDLPVPKRFDKHNQTTFDPISSRLDR